MAELKMANGETALVDDEDCAWISRWTWRCNAMGYAIRSLRLGDRTVGLFMHRAIADWHNWNMPDGHVIDHKDLNKLNNTKGNLRIATPSQNGRNSKLSSRNTSGYKGVIWSKAAGKWQAALTATGKNRYIGLYNTVEEAAEAYRIASEKESGEFFRAS